MLATIVSNGTPSDADCIWRPTITGLMKPTMSPSGRPLRSAAPELSSIVAIEST